MTIPSHDTFPDEFDPSRLGPPTAETQGQLVEALDGLEPFASSDRTRAVALSYGNTDLPVSVNVYCAQHDGVDSLGNKRTGYSTLNVSVQGEEGRFLLNAGSGSLDDSDREKMDSTVAKIIADLPEDEASWLGEAWAETKLEDKNLVPLSVDRLLDTAPYPVFEHVLHFIRASFHNGASITGDWLTGNEAFMSEFPPDQAVQTLFVTSFTGQEYEYRRYGSGREEVLAKVAGEKVIREVETPAVIESDRGHGLTVSVRGDATFMRRLQTAIDERREADRLGMSKPTEGSVKDLTDVINAAIESGRIQPKS